MFKHPLLTKVASLEFVGASNLRPWHAGHPWATRAQRCPFPVGAFFPPLPPSLLRFKWGSRMIHTLPEQVLWALPPSLRTLEIEPDISPSWSSITHLTCLRCLSGGHLEGPAPPPTAAPFSRLVHLKLEWTCVSIPPNLTHLQLAQLSVPATRSRVHPRIGPYLQRIPRAGVPADPNTFQRLTHVRVGDAWMEDIKLLLEHAPNLKQLDVQSVRRSVDALAAMEPIVDIGPVSPTFEGISIDEEWWWSTAEQAMLMMMLLPSLGPWLREVQIGYALVPAAMWGRLFPRLRTVSLGVPPLGSQHPATDVGWHSVWKVLGNKAFMPQLQTVRLIAAPHITAAPPAPTTAPPDWLSVELG